MLRAFFGVFVCSLLSAQVRVPGPGGSAAAGGTAPSGFSASGGVVAQGGGFTFTLPSINVSSGQGVIVSFGAHDSTFNYCAQITGVTATGGDTLTSLGTVAYTTSLSSCIDIYAIWNPTPNATYVITIQGNSSAPASLVHVELLFTKGSVAGTADGTCSNTSAGATSLTCSSAISPTGTIDLCYAASFAYDGTGGTAADNSSPTFTLPSGGNAVDSGTGRLVVSYYVGNPPDGSVTPGISGLGLGDPIVVWGTCSK